MTDAQGAVPGYRPFPPFSTWSDIAFDPTLYDRYERLLTQTREAADPDALQAAVRIATRVAAVDTGAIEGLYEVDRGFTRTVAVEAAAWEAAVATRGTAARDAIEDALAAYEFVLDAATSSVAISEVWIRQLHATVTKSQETHPVHTSVGVQDQPLPKGQYKSMPNSPTNRSTGRVHHYAPPDDTGPEMARLVSELAGTGFRGAHPVIQAAFAHYAFVCVHPFADGNGRVARALASVFLYRRPGVPLVVFADEKPPYLDALEAADAGNAVPLIQFMEQRVIDAIEIVRNHIVTSDLPTVEAGLNRINSLLVGRGGLTHPEVDAAADRLLVLLNDEFSKQLGAMTLPTGVRHMQQFRTGGLVSPPAGYRQVLSSPRSLDVVLSSDIPAPANWNHTLAVAVALPAVDSADLVAWAFQDPENHLEVRLRELTPLPTSVLALKITGWVERHLRAMVAILSNNIEKLLQQHGYIT